MSKDPFGHDPEPMIVCGRCSRRIDADGRHIPNWKDEPRYVQVAIVRWQEWAQKEAAEKAALAASLRPYTGSIAQCQVGITSNDRAALYSRCERKPKHIRETRDGAMAVCGTHAKAYSVSRYVGEKNIYRGGPRPPANEPVQ